MNTAADFDAYLSLRSISIEKYERATISEQGFILAAYESSRTGNSSNAADYFSKHPSISILIYLSKLTLTLDAIAAVQKSIMDAIRRELDEFNQKIVCLETKGGVPSISYEEYALHTNEIIALRNQASGLTNLAAAQFPVGMMNISI